jgi:starvation-inducible DNA-binding protein
MGFVMKNQSKVVKATALVEKADPLMDFYYIDEAENEETTVDLNSALRELLANNFSVYLRAHGYHWNVKGIHFAAYHEFFGEIYEDLYSAIDPTAEWLRKLGYDAPYTMEEFLVDRNIKDASKQVALSMMIQSLLQAIEALEESTEHCLEIATAEDEQGLMNFLAGRIDMLEKWEWQLNTSVNEGFI